MGRVLAFEVAACHRDPLRALGLRAPEDFLGAPCGVVVKAARPGREVRCVGEGAHRYFVKRVAGRGWREIPHEHRLLKELGRLGLPVAEPVGLAVGTRRGALVTRALPIARTLEDRLLGGVSPASMRALIPAVAGLVRRLHAAGANHRDLYTGHVLLDAEDRPFLVDLGRAERRPRVPWRRAVKDLAALHLSTPERVLDARGRLRFLLLYANGASRRRVRRLVAAVARKAARMRRHAERQIARGAPNVHVPA